MAAMASLVGLCVQRVADGSKLLDVTAHRGSPGPGCRHGAAARERGHSTSPVGRTGAIGATQWSSYPSAVWCDVQFAAGSRDVVYSGVVHANGGAVVCGDADAQRLMLRVNGCRARYFPVGRR